MSTVTTSNQTESSAPAFHILLHSPSARSTTNSVERLISIPCAQFPTPVDVYCQESGTPRQRHHGILKDFKHAPSSLPDPFTDSLEDLRIETEINYQVDSWNTAGSIQDVGAVIGLSQGSDGALRVLLISDNSEAVLGHSPSSLFALDNFLDILSDEESETLLDCISSLHGPSYDNSTPNVFKLSIQSPDGRENDFSCVLHTDATNSNLIICELEVEENAWSACYPLQNTRTQHCQHTKKSLRRQYCRQRSTGSVTNMLGTMSRAHEGMSTAKTLDGLFEHVVRTFQDITRHANVTVQRFDKHWNSWSIAQGDVSHSFRYTAQEKDLQSHPLSSECREMYETQKVQVCHGKGIKTARLIARPGTQLPNLPTNTSLYLRTSPPSLSDHLSNKTIQSSVSIPLEVYGKLWGVVTCQSHTPSPIPVSFLTRGLCRHVGDLTSRKLERTMFSKSSTEERTFLMNQPSTRQHLPQSLTTPLDLLSTMGADFAILSIHGRKEFKGTATAPHEGFALIEYFHTQKLAEVVTSVQIATDFPDLLYQPGFHSVDELLYIPLSVTGEDFVIFFREKPSVLNARGNRGWGDNDLQHAAIIRLVYSKLDTLWKQKEGAMQETHLYKLLISNSSHEFRTLLNAIMNYLEFAMDGKMDDRTKGFLMKAKSTGRPLLGAVTKLLDFIEKDCRVSGTVR